jgi:hypothetical protein
MGFWAEEGWKMVALLSGKRLLLGGRTTLLDKRGGRRLRCLVGRWLHCWVGENWTAGREKGGATSALLDKRGLRCWVGQRCETVALRDGRGGRQLPCWVGQRLRCWVGENWTAWWDNYCCPALLDGLLGNKKVDDNCAAWVGENWTAGREKGVATAALLDGKGLRCWVSERWWTTVALLGGRRAALLGGRELDCWAGEGWIDCCAAGWERTTLLGKTTVALLDWTLAAALLGGRELDCWAVEG